jgi:arsenate reductase
MKPDNRPTAAPMRQRVAIYHNPKCSKSRQALSLLRANGVEPEVIEYLEQPLDRERIRDLIGMLGIPAHDLVRMKEAPYKRLKLSPSSTTEEIAKAIAENPILLERPVIVCGKSAIIGRPPERVLSWLRRNRRKSATSGKPET